MRARRTSAMLLLGAVGVIAAATLVPPQGAASTSAPGAWCLVCGPSPAANALANVALFLPLGAALYLRGVSARWTVLAGVSLSLAVELVQWTGLLGARSPSIADVVTNAFGALLGWGLLHLARQGWRVSGPAAYPLAAAWGVAVIGVLTLTTLGVQPWAPATSGSRAARTVMRASPFSYSPAFGYYGGAIRHVVVNDYVVPHPGYGPLVREVVTAGDTLQVMIALGHLEPSTTRRSVAFLHAVGDSTPLLMLAQVGSRFEIRRKTRAEASGLAPLMLGVETGRWDPARPVRVHAVSSAQRLAIATSRDGREAFRELALTPLIGWALWQSVVVPGNAAASMVQALWTGLLFLPLGWLVQGAHERRRAVNSGAHATWLAGAAMLLIVLPAAGAVHALRALDWLVVGLAYVGGAALRARIVGPDMCEDPHG